MGQDDLANKLENIKVTIIRPRIEKRLIFKLAGNKSEKGQIFRLVKAIASLYIHNIKFKTCDLK